MFYFECFDLEDFVIFVCVVKKLKMVVFAKDAVELIIPHVEIQSE